MGTVLYGLRYALSRSRVIELSIDAATSQELADWTIAVAVVRGIPHLLPAKLDPWFRYRLGRVSPPGAAGGDAPGSIRETKLESILRILTSCPLTELATIDLDRSGDRLALTYGRHRAQRPDGRSADGAVTECVSGQLSIGRWTSDVILIGLSEDEIGATKSVQVGSDALSALCGVRSLATTSLHILPSKATTLVSVPTTF